MQNFTKILHFLYFDRALTFASAGISVFWHFSTKNEAKFVQNYLLTKSRNSDIIISEREVIIMTTKQLIEAWDEFLNVEFGCYADENDNRPCDNGALCDRCSDEKINKFFREKIGIGA